MSTFGYAEDTRRLGNTQINLVLLSTYSYLCGARHDMAGTANFLMMKTIDITVPVVAMGYDELDEAQRALVDKAREYTGHAYAPYSRFSVGAAIRLDNGVIVPGANQENAAYPSGTCAERSACYWAHARYPEARFESIAIASLGTDGREPEVPTAPCGACRQALLEYEKLAGHDVEVLLAGAGVIYRLPSVRSLLPLAFSEF